MSIFEIDMKAFHVCYDKTKVGTLIQDQWPKPLFLSMFDDEVNWGSPPGVAFQLCLGLQQEIYLRSLIQKKMIRVRQFQGCDKTHYFRVIAALC